MLQEEYLNTTIGDLLRPKQSTNNSYVCYPLYGGEHQPWNEFGDLILGNESISPGDVCVIVKILKGSCANKSYYKIFTARGKCGWIRADRAKVAKKTSWR